MSTRLVIRNGEGFCVYDDRWLPIIDAIGKADIRRASEVEYERASGDWVAKYLRTGQEIARGKLRSQVIADEVHWLETNIICARTRAPEPAEVAYQEIQGYPGYRIGTDATVWSCWTQGKHARQVDQWHRIKPAANGRYITVSLRIAFKRRRTFALHILMLKTFVGPCPPGMEARHLDGHKHNCRLGNLAWGTKEQNVSDWLKQKGHARKMGLRVTPEIVLEMRRQYESGATRQALMEQYNLHDYIVYNILRGKTWRWVK